LRDDGVVFISIDDHEVAHLRSMCDQIFGEENCLGCLIWQRRASSALADNNLSSDHDYVLCYKKILSQDFTGKVKGYKQYKNPDNDSRGAWILDNLTVGMTASQRPNQAYDLIDPSTGKIYPYNSNRVWAYAPESMSKLIKEGRIYFPKEVSRRPMLKRFKNELKNTHNPFSTLMLSQVGLNMEGTKIIQDLLETKVFEYSKPISLLYVLTQQISKANNDIILDFFSGSGTTAHAVMQLNAEDGGNRKYIMVQLPEPTPNDSEARKAGYNTVAEIGKERIRRAAAKLREANPDKPNLDLGFKVFKLDQSNFKVWNDHLDEATDLQEKLKFHVNPLDVHSSPEDVLYELLIKSGYEFTVRVDTINIDDKEVYAIQNNELLICLDKNLNEAVIEAIAALKPRKVIFLDAAFQGNDQLKLNAAETFKILSQDEASETVFVTV
jgi:adenine-specific DNA-methyltransferase